MPKMISTCILLIYLKVISKKKGGHYCPRLPYRLKGEEIVTTSHHSYMGVEIQGDGKWSKHVENCTKKANRAFGFIRRNFGRCPESIKETLYTQPWLDLTWNMHLGDGTLISKRILTN